MYQALFAVENLTRDAFQNVFLADRQNKTQTEMSQEQKKKIFFHRKYV